MPPCLRGSSLVIVLATLLIAALCAPAQAAIAVTDDAGNELVLEAPAERVVALAPHAVEALFHVGAGGTLVGVSTYSDWPPEARDIPRVGSDRRIDFEAVLALRPDVVVVWQSGNGPRTAEKLRALGLKVYVTEPRTLEDIAATLERLGRLTGREQRAVESARAFRDQLASLVERYSDRSEVSVFYQIWHQPLMTVNGEHLISEVIRLCGGRNIFSDLRSLAPTVDVESVLAARPQVIIVSGADAGRPAVMDDWRRWPRLPAVAENQLYFIPPDIIQRHSPRILEGARVLCEQLEQARS